MKRILPALASIIMVATLGLATLSCAITTKPTTTTTPATIKPATSTTSSTSTTPLISKPTYSGILEVRVTDAPPKEEITSIMVTASKIEVHRVVTEKEQQSTQTTQTTEPTTEEDQGEWLTIDIVSGAQAFDLLKIKGVEKLFASGEIETGKYTQLRLTISKIEVALVDGKLKPAIVPSGELKFNHPFDIVAGAKTVVTLDFDAEKSVNITGNDEIQVKPVVSLVVKQQPTAATTTTTTTPQ